MFRNRGVRLAWRKGKGEEEGHGEEMLSLGLKGSSLGGRKGQSVMAGERRLRE